MFSARSLWGACTIVHSGEQCVLECDGIGSFDLNGFRKASGQPYVALLYDDMIRRSWASRARANDTSFDLTDAMRSKLREFGKRKRRRLRRPMDGPRPQIQ